MDCIDLAQSQSGGFLRSELCKTFSRGAIAPTPPMTLETTNKGLQQALSALRKQNQQLKQQIEFWRNTAMSTQKSLVDYLKSLNSAETQWGIWVNPENIDDYRIGQFQFENGGILDDWICIGSLDKLSFGFQSTSEAIAQFIKDNKELLNYKDRPVKVNLKGIIEAYGSGYLDDDFRAYLEEKAEEVERIWSEMEAEDFVSNKVPEIIEQALNDCACTLV